jgi:DegV family protein with EDD domain
LSATYNAAVQAARLVEGARIICVDSHSIAMPIAYLALAAARRLAQGATLEEAVALVETLREQTVAYVALQTLRYLERGGRISRTRALLGTLLDVKPILEVRDSQVLPVERVRTWRRVPARLLELVQARGAYQELSVVYTTNRAEAESLADACAAAGLLARDRIRTVQIGAVLGTHMGPGALGITGLLNA